MSANLPAWYRFAYRITQSRLQRSEDEMAGLFVDLEMELTSVSRRMAKTFVSLGSSAAADALTDDDAAFWGEAVGLVAAGRLRPALGAKTATTEIITQKEDETEVQYAKPAPSPSGDKSVMDIWADEAWDRVQQVTCIAAERATFNASVSLFNVAGPRRDAEAAGYASNPYNPLYMILVDEARAEGIEPPVGSGPWY